MNFGSVKAFLESWGLHFDTPDGDSQTIPYPQVYNRMQDDAKQVGGDELSRLISRVTDTTDGQTYLAFESWEDLETEFSSIWGR